MRTKEILADEPAIRIVKPGVDNTQLIDFTHRKSVNDVSFGNGVRILATTLPQFLLPNLFQLRVFRLRSDENRNIGVGVFPESEEILVSCAGFGSFTLHRVRTPEL